jgi:hypothetical protein
VQRPNQSIYEVQTNSHLRSLNQRKPVRKSNQLKSMTSAQSHTNTNQQNPIWKPKSLNDDCSIPKTQSSIPSNTLLQIQKVALVQLPRIQRRPPPGQKQRSIDFSTKIPENSRETSNLNLNLETGSGMNNSRHSDTKTLTMQIEQSRNNTQHVTEVFKNRDPVNYWLNIQHST